MSETHNVESSEEARSQEHRLQEAADKLYNFVDASEGKPPMWIGKRQFAGQSIYRTLDIPLTLSDIRDRAPISIANQLRLLDLDTHTPVILQVGLEYENTRNFFISLMPYIARIGLIGASFSTIRRRGEIIYSKYSPQTNTTELEFKPLLSSAIDLPEKVAKFHYMYNRMNVIKADGSRDRELVKILTEGADFALKMITPYQKEPADPLAEYLKDLDSDDPEVLRGIVEKLRSFIGGLTHAALSSHEQVQQLKREVESLKRTSAIPADPGMRFLALCGISMSQIQELPHDERRNTIRRLRAVANQLYHQDNSVHRGNSDLGAVNNLLTELERGRGPRL